jgi:predicted DsbA family dithiol-disulfide isomerase
MEIEIWSDIQCPFCYIGKRRFEQALDQFDQKDQVHITWKSYQLAPEMITDPSMSIDEYLAQHKGITRSEAKQMNDYVTAMASSLGLQYNFNKTIPANSFKAHQLSHLAKQSGLQNQLEENLFKAYFTEGKNMDDIPTLLRIGKDSGLNESEIMDVFEKNQYADAVRQDIYEASQIGVRGVPFFVFNRKYAVSGAQEASVFVKALKQSFEEWMKEK